MKSTTWKRAHAGGVLLALALWLAAARLHWLASVEFVSHVSMAALVYAALCAYQGTRTEVKQDQANGVDY